MKKREVKNGKNITLVSIITFILLFIVGSALIFIVDKSTSNTTLPEKEASNKEEKSTSNKQLDLTKSLNTTNYTYSNAVVANNSYHGIVINEGNKNDIIVKLNWYDGFEKLYNNVVTSQGGAHLDVEEVKVIGLNGDVKKAVVGELGQSPVSLTLFYLLDDGTVQYHRLFKKTTDASGNQYYVLNRDENGFAIEGSIPKAVNVVELYNVQSNEANHTGASTVIGATSDGSFYDLGYEVNNAYNSNNEYVVNKELDLTKSLNTTNYTYSNAVAASNSYHGIVINEGSKNNTIVTLNWNDGFDKLYNNVVTTQGGAHLDIEEVKVVGLKGSVKKAVVGGLGQSAVSLTLFYLLDDGTIQYHRLFKKTTDASGNQYYVLNRDENGFAIEGSIPKAENVVELYNVQSNEANHTGASTVIGATSNGSFYDLGYEINR